MIGQYINGKIVEGNGAMLNVINPATEKIVDKIRNIDKKQALETLEKANNAFKQWSLFSLHQREEWIINLATAIENEKDFIMDLLIKETGKNVSSAEYEVNMLIDCLRYFIEEAKRLDGNIIEDYDNQTLNLIVKKPLGVVVGYLAWNFPLLNLGYKIGPALASGCTCIVRPSELTPLATLYIGSIAERIGFPAGVLNIISGSSKEIPEVLSGSTIPKMITLIGSSRTGMTVMNQSLTSVKHYSLELGGNAPAIVMADADVEKAASMITGLKFGNCGQVCVAPNRVLVHESIYDDFLRIANNYATSLKYGWGRDSQASLGPMITKKAQERIGQLVEDAVKKGGKIICGGNIPTSEPIGYYFEPTIISEAKPDMKIFSEEIFGPIMPVMKFQDIEHVITEANNTEYGLAAYLFTESLNNALTISDTIQAGTVCVNTVAYAVNLPHGGIKESGIGKDCSRYSLEEYYYTKRISIAK